MPAFKKVGGMPQASGDTFRRALGLISRPDYWRPRTPNGIPAAPSVPGQQLGDSMSITTVTRFHAIAGEEDALLQLQTEGR